MEIKKLVMLRFPKEISEKPIIYGLAKNFDVVFSILKGKIDLSQEGELLLSLSGSEEQILKSLDYLKRSGVIIESVKVRRNDEKCTNCTACVTICPSEALFVSDRKKMTVSFDKEKCVDCELCIDACPFRAMEITL